jgi:RHH-type transcriptional regulator, rel operon repressor / antitoxin RelB
MRRCATHCCKQEERLRRKSEKRLEVIAVRVAPAIEQRLRLLAEVTGRSQSFFLKQLIGKGIDAMEEAWLSHEVVAQVRSGALPAQPRGTTPDLFGDPLWEQ